MRTLATLLVAATLLLSACTRQEDLASRDLFHACEMGDMRGARFYMAEEGTDLDKADDLGRTPVSIALLRGEGAIARLLFENGAQCPKAAENQTPVMHYLIEWQDMDLLHLMLENGADANLEYTTPQGKRTTPLIQCTRTNLPGLIDLLIQKGANPEQECEEWSALEVASDQGFVRAVRALLEGGAKPTPNAIALAKARGFKDIIEQLQKAGE